MPDPLKRYEDNPDPARRKMINIRGETYAKLKKLADKHDTYLSEVVRYLVDLADEKQIEIR